MKIIFSVANLEGDVVRSLGKIRLGVYARPTVSSGVLADLSMYNTNFRFCENSPFDADEDFFDFLQRGVKGKVYQEAIKTIDDVFTGSGVMKRGDLLDLLIQHVVLPALKSYAATYPEYVSTFGLEVNVKSINGRAMLERWSYNLGGVKSVRRLGRNLSASRRPSSGLFMSTNPLGGAAAGVGAPRRPAMMGGAAAGVGAPRRPAMMGGAAAGVGAPRRPAMMGGAAAGVGVPRPAMTGGAGGGVGALRHQVRVGVAGVFVSAHDFGMAKADYERSGREVSSLVAVPKETPVYPNYLDNLTVTVMDKAYKAYKLSTPSQLFAAQQRLAAECLEAAERLDDRVMAELLDDDVMDVDKPECGRKVTGSFKP
ncbi:MAG: hypothetical protein P1U40_08195 [Coxiellaceae bacterium]|nr:hypothetical protein [Coxiellaceae bacterium]